MSRIAAVFGADVGLGVALVLDGGDVAEGLVSLPAAEEGVGRLARVAFQVVDVGVRELRVPLVNNGDLDLVRVGLADVNRAALCASGCLGDGSWPAILCALGVTVAQVADDPVLVRDRVTGAAPYWSPARAEFWLWMLVPFGGGLLGDSGFLRAAALHALESRSIAPTSIPCSPRSSRLV